MADDYKDYKHINVTGTFTSGTFQQLRQFIKPLKDIIIAKGDKIELKPSTNSIQNIVKPVFVRYNGQPISSFSSKSVTVINDRSKTKDLFRIAIDIRYYTTSSITDMGHIKTNENNVLTVNGHIFTLINHTSKTIYTIKGDILYKSIPNLGSIISTSPKQELPPIKGNELNLNTLYKYRSLSAPNAKPDIYSFLCFKDANIVFEGETLVAESDIGMTLAEFTKEQMSMNVKLIFEKDGSTVLTHKAKTMSTPFYSSKKDQYLFLDYSNNQIHIEKRSREKW